MVVVKVHKNVYRSKNDTFKRVWFINLQSQIPEKLKRTGEMQNNLTYIFHFLAETKKKKKQSQFPGKIFCLAEYS